MPQPIASAERNNWLRPALGIVLGVTALRWLLLAFDSTDLYVDEAQYWLWGQEFAFGYYSKPPLIGWLIGAVTSLAGSDSVFWVRMPGAALHGATALILAAWAARRLDGRAAVLVAAVYVTLPMAALGSLLISTDTVMAPFFATALYFHHRLTETRSPRFALLAGLAIGVAFMAKYAAIYFLIGVALGALRRDGRIGWANAGLLLLAFGVVISPNILWNLNHQLTTFSHTADNVGWVRQDNPLAALHPMGAVEFLLSQFAVVGPVVFGALLIGLWKPGRGAGLWPFIVPPLAVVTFQALLGEAQANWAVAAFFAGSLLAVAVLAGHRRWITASFVVNGAIAVIMPLLVIFTDISPDGKVKLLDRQLGRASFSQQIIAISQQNGNLPIYTDNRDILADLFYTGRDAGLTVYATAPKGRRPENHYEQRYPLPDGLSGPILVIATTPPACTPTPAPIALDPMGGAYSKWGRAAYIVDVGCLYAD